MRLAVVLVGAFALVPGAGAAPRQGHVVRIERTSRAFAGVPRLCLIQADALNQASGPCYGTKPPAPGEVITVFDATHVVAQVRVTNVTPGNDPSCADSGQWIVTGTPISGQLSFQAGMSVIDVPLDTRVAKLTKDWRTPHGRSSAGETVVVAVDGDGDGGVDLEFVAFPCDDTGAPATNGGMQCLESWTVNGRGFELVHQDRYRNCF